MVKILVEYKKEIHEKLVKYMDGQIAKGNEKMQQGINIPTKELNIMGRRVVVGQKLKDTVNQSLIFSFYYTVIGEGKMEIIFKSLGDKVPVLSKVYNKSCKAKIHNSLKREFKDGIISVKEVK